MQKGKDRPIPSGSRNLRRRQFQPGLQDLERRELLAIDLVNVAGAAPGGPGPFGVLEVGLEQGGGIGWSTAEVGDVNGDGFSDFVVGAPTVDINGLIPIVGTASNARAYLVLGSNDVNRGPVNWLSLNANERIGDMAALGNSNQTNPVTGTPGFAFNGLSFFTGNTPSSQLGASVAAAGDVNNDGFADFLLGAPGAPDTTGANAGTGRAYLVYGSASLGNRATKLVDLDSINTINDINVLTFTNIAQVNSRTGTAVAGIGDFIVDGGPDIAIGAPNATVTGLANQGAIYVISNSVLRPARTQTITLNTVGQQGGVGGFLLAGGSSGDDAGSSIARGGNIAGRIPIGGGTPSDLLIGAPDRTPGGTVIGTGSAFLVYANTAANLQNLTTVSNNLTVIPLSQVGISIPGAQFEGSALGDSTGFSVAPAGDFNNDGIDDFTIGSPFWNGPAGVASGRTNLIFGVSINASTGPLFGVYNLDALPPGVLTTQFNGIGPFAWAGWSNTVVGPINADTINEIAIGSPGVNGGSGQVYLIPGNPDLIGTFSLGSTEALPIQGLTITLGSFAGQPANAPTFLGTSVSGRLGVTPSSNTLDQDTKGDLIIGTSGFSLNSARNGAGGVFALEGAFLPLPTPVPTFIPVTIGVDAPFPPFVVNATTPAEMDIYIFSNATTQPPFDPVNDINPTTIVVNGVAFPNAVLTSSGQDFNNDGIIDAIVTITPRTALGLSAQTTSLNVQGQTLPTSIGGVRRFQGSAAISVAGGGGGGGGAPATRNTRGFFDPNLAVPPFGSRFVPNPATVYKFQWQRNVPSQLLFRQFQPDYYSSGRHRRFYHGDDPGRPNGSMYKDAASGINTLGRRVFTRSQYPNGFFDARRFGQGRK